MRTERKMESTDSPEIPDTGKTSEAPGLPWGLVWIGFGGESGVE